MTVVLFHQKSAGSEGATDVPAFTLGDVGADKLRYPGLAPLLVASPVLHVVWAAPGKEIGQYGDMPQPTGYDVKTGAPIFAQQPGGPRHVVSYDPATGAAIYDEPAAPAKPAAQPAEVTNASLSRVPSPA